MKKKIYCFNNGGRPGWYEAIAIAEDGNVLANHICSDEGFMRHDLGIVGTWKHELYDKHYGKDGWELVWVPTNELSTHVELQATFGRNKALGEAANAARTAGVTIEMSDGSKIEVRA